MAGDDDEDLIATFEAALAALVADGASPTQAHVAALKTAYARAAPAIAARLGIVEPQSGQGGPECLQ